MNNCPKRTYAEVRYTETVMILYLLVTLILIINAVFFALVEFNAISLEPSQVHNISLVIYCIVTVLVVAYILAGALFAQPVTEKFPAWYLGVCVLVVSCIGLVAVLDYAQLFGGILSLSLWVYGFKRLCSHLKDKS